MFESFFGPTVPARRAYAITPDDDADVARVTRGVICGGAGNLNCILADDTSAVVIPVLAGPQNPAFQGTAHDGGDIGAVAVVVPPASGGTPGIALSCSMAL